ncbi:Glutamate receptor-like 9 [Homarus americanus]|uniref:Glutamate receptor-like 9 n=1 Tax=Homarus americanus TaxID=6706 RepID=A0A8J5N6Y1_HOMAM|nr:Glutamate receptor-like 9 [Homarus americanus]
MFLPVQEQVQEQQFLGGLAATWLYLQRGMFSQSVPALPRALWQRIFLAIWYLYCLVVSAAYTCNLIAIFTSPAYPQRITTLQQLADSEYRLAMEDVGGALMELLNDADDEVHLRLLEKLDLFPHMSDAVDTLKAGTHGFVWDVTTGINILGDHYKVFNWYNVRTPLLPSYASWFFPKHTPWKNKFDQGILRLVQCGVIQHLLEEGTNELLGWHWKLRLQERQEPVMGITLEHLKGVFFILFLAWTTSVAVFLLELLRHRYFHR